MTRLLPAVLLALAGACNAYDPKLGYEPFQCGDSEPRCPLGYTCVMFQGGEAICRQTDVELPDAGDDDGDDGDVDCNDDRDVEPNDSTAQAFDSGIPDSRSEFEIVGLAICPTSDVDLFKFEVATSGVNVVAEIEYRPSRGELLLDVLNMSGTSIASGAAVEGTPNTLRAEVANLPAGTYYVQVRAIEDVENNYDRVTITTSGP